MTAGAIDREGRPVIDPVNDMLKSRFTVRVFIAPPARDDRTSTGRIDTDAGVVVESAFRSTTRRSNGN
jgi:hypothetical protein